MRIDRADAEVIDIVLSRRNLLTLLVKLSGHPANSACTIGWPGAEGQPTLLVRAEPDGRHYADRAPAGTMVCQTEGALRRLHKRARHAVADLSDEELNTRIAKLKHRSADE